MLLLLQKISAFICILDQHYEINSHPHYNATTFASPAVFEKFNLNSKLMNNNISYLKCQERDSHCELQKYSFLRFKIKRKSDLLQWLCDLVSVVLWMRWRSNECCLPKIAVGCAVRNNASSNTGCALSASQCLAFAIDACLISNVTPLKQRYNLRVKLSGDFFFSSRK